MIRARKGPNGTAYQVIVEPFKAQTVYTRSAANRLEIDLKNRKALGAHLRQADPHTLGEELDGYDQRRAATKTLRPNTERSYAQTSKAWRDLRPLLVSVLTREMVEDAFTKRAAQHPVMADKELKWLKATLRQAMSRGQQVDPAIFDIRPVNHKPRRGNVATVEQLHLLASWMPEYIRRIVPVAGMVGARQAFWFNLRDTMIDLDARTMLAPAELQKNGRDLHVCLSDIEVGLLREQLLARPNGTDLVFPTMGGTVWNRSNFAKRVWDGATAAAARSEHEAGVRASIFEDFNFHDLRKTAASLMARSGMEPAVAAERIGHTDGGALFFKTYRMLYADERRRAADAFGAFLEGEQRKAEGGRG